MTFAKLASGGKDLLDRHLQIHQQGGSAGKRWRRPRACTRCSRLKIRCDISTPCSRCARGKYDCICKSKDRSGRQIGGKSPASNHSHGTSSSDSAGSVEEGAGGTVMAATMPETDFTEVTHQAMDLTQDLKVAPAREDTLWSQTATWPWLHQQQRHLTGCSAGEFSPSFQLGLGWLITSKYTG